MSLEIMTSVDLNENSVTGIPDNIQTVGGKKMHALDDALSGESENPVQNKAIKAQLDALDRKIDGKTVEVDGYTIKKNNQGTLYGVGYEVVVNNSAKGELFNVNATGGLLPSGIGSATGIKSHGEGNNPTATGDYSHAEGHSGVAVGSASHAEGYTSVARGDYSHAEGRQVTAVGEASHAEGYTTVASGNYSHAEGYTTVATGDYSHTEGHQVTAYGESSHAEGYGEHQYQSSMGTNVRSLFDIAGTANGRMSLAFGDYSHAEGASSVALEEGSHAEGKYSRAMGSFSHAEGYMSCTSKQTGLASHAEGNETDAYETASHAEGYRTRAVGYGSHAEGLGSSTNSIPSYYLYESMSGYQVAQMWVNSDINVAYSSACHTEGWGCVAISQYSHAEGSNTLAYGSTSHSEGYGTDAYGNYSHIEGYSANKFFPASLSDSEIITAFSQSASFSLAKGSASHVEGSCNIALGDNSHAEGAYNAVVYPHSHVEGYENVVYGSESHAEGASNTINSGSNYSHAEGYHNTISGNGYSHAEGRQNVINGNYSHAEGYSNNITNANYAHAEGSENTITGHYTHAEGSHNSAAGQYGHVEGYGNAATGAYSHAEGNNNTALGYASHVEGCLNDGKGSYIHIEGYHNSITGINDNTNIPGLHISGAFNRLSGDCSKGGTLVAGALNSNLYLGSYAGFVAGCNNYIGSSSFAMGRKLAAGHGCAAIGNWNRQGDISAPNIKMKYSTDTNDGRHRCYTITDSQDNVIKLVIRLDGLNYDNIINKTHITNLKVNGVDVSSDDYTVTMTPPSSDFENYEMIQVYYLIIETSNITPAQDYTVYIDISGYDMSSYPYIFVIGNGVYASDEDCNDQHDANALAVTFNGTLKVQNNVTFKYVDGNTQKHRISLRKIVDALLGMGVSITDLETSENDM